MEHQVRPLAWPDCTVLSPARHSRVCHPIPQDRGAHWRYPSHLVKREPPHRRSPKSVLFLDKPRASAETVRTHKPTAQPATEMPCLSQPYPEYAARASSLVPAIHTPWYKTQQTPAYMQSSGVPDPLPPDHL